MEEEEDDDLDSGADNGAQSSGCFVLQWSHWTDISDVGMCPGGLWSVLASVCADISCDLPHPSLHCQESHRRLRCLKQCLPGTGILLHYRDRCVRFWTSCHPCKNFCDQVGSLWPGVSWQRGHFYHHSRLLPCFRERG